jgi:RNA polymerase sigma factor (sigma-70 family)
MNDRDWLAERFEENRPHLRAVAYRMLGSLSEADDAIQESWLRLSRTNAEAIENLRAWLTTVVGRICLNVLRLRANRREEPLVVHLPDPILSRAERTDPEHAVILADSVGLALLVVLETLEPDERLALVLHDMFAVPFDEIAPIVGCTPTAARQLASRARRRVQGNVPAPDVSIVRQREVVDAFLAAVREGDFDDLMKVLDPDVVARADRGRVSPVAPSIIRGARAVAEGAMQFSRNRDVARQVLVNGGAGLVGVDPNGQLLWLMGFTVAEGKIVAIHILHDPERLRRIDRSVVVD